MKRVWAYTLLLVLSLLFGCRPAEPEVRVKNQTTQTIKLRWQGWDGLRYMAILPPGALVLLEKNMPGLDTLEVVLGEKHTRYEMIGLASGCHGPERWGWESLQKGPGPSVIDASLMPEGGIWCEERETLAPTPLARPELRGPHYEYQGD
ncbi:hypothetical protein [Chitinilyticum piscinae]|uniref:Lipoprotein n=1 Tax=Chitinilyticum piscinae TaxID=2866724 RepID=A0A8J7K1N9_9NEIS|nr:hypothetical protein [Chitinilyticum piscinae]MBE9609491.1 hypothetical protein [Chitinilyticum piscinae]